jgi:predicted N-acetyltransferase YhbS
MATIRRYREDDLYGIAALRAAWASNAQHRVSPDPRFLESFQLWLHSNPRIIFVAEEEGELIGMVNLQVFERMPKPGRKASCWVYLSNAFVSPGSRNGGVGSSLLRMVIAHARSIGAVRITLSPTADSIDFYKRAGFESADELLVHRL